jgi:hypothetical protein
VKKILEQRRLNKVRYVHAVFTDSNGDITYTELRAG